MTNEHGGRTSGQEQGNQRAMSLKDILGDQKKSALFGEMLKSQNHLDVAKRLRNKETTDQDLTMLTGEGMKEFEKRMKSAEKLSSMMTPQNMEKLRECKSEKMQSILKAIGVEGVRGAITPQIEMLAIQDPGRMETLVKSFEFMTTREKQQKDADTKLGGLIEKYGVSKDKYDEIMKNPDRTQRSLQLEQAVHDAMGRVPGLRRKTKEKNSKKRGEDVLVRANELSDRSEITAAKTQYEFALTNIGDTLGSIMFGNEATKNAFNNILHGESSEKEELLSFEESKHIAVPEEGDLTKDWEKWSEGETKAERSPEKDRFFNSYVDGKTNNKKGMWRDVMKNLIMGMAKF